MFQGKTSTSGLKSEKENISLQLKDNKGNSWRKKENQIHQILLYGT